MQTSIQSSTLIRRITKEISECKENGIDLIVNDSNITKMECILLGPEDSEYEGGIFRLYIEFPNRYPFSAPNIKFINKIFHPNVSNSGDICLDILKDKWSPALSLHKVMLSIQSLLTDPNPDSPLNGDAAHLYKTDRKEYKKKCQRYILENDVKDNKPKKI